jgi:hypothetical protein
MMFFNIAYLAGGAAMLICGVMMLSSLQLGALPFGVFAVLAGIGFLALGMAGMVLAFRK